jgi:hypothetical protein
VYGLLVYKDKQHERGEETTDNEVHEEYDGLEARRKRWGDEGLVKAGGAVQIQAAETPKPAESIGLGQGGAGRAQRAPPGDVAAIPTFRPRGNKTPTLHVSPRHSLTHQ